VIAYVYNVKNAPNQPPPAPPERDQKKMKWFAGALSVVLAAVLIVPHLPAISFSNQNPAPQTEPQGLAQVRLVACDWRSTRLTDEYSVLRPGQMTEFYRAYITRPSGKQDYCEFSYDPRDGSTLLNHVESDGDTRYRAFGPSPEANLSAWLTGKADRLGSQGELARSLPPEFNRPAL